MQITIELESDGFSNSLNICFESTNYCHCPKYKRKFDHKKLIYLTNFKLNTLTFIYLTFILYLRLEKVFVTRWSGKLGRQFSLRDKKSVIGSTPPLTN